MFRFVSMSAWSVKICYQTYMYIHVFSVCTVSKWIWNLTFRWKFSFKKIIYIRKLHRYFPVILDSVTIVKKVQYCNCLLSCHARVCNCYCFTFSLTELPKKTKKVLRMPLVGQIDFHPLMNTMKPTEVRWYDRPCRIIVLYQIRKWWICLKGCWYVT